MIHIEINEFFFYSGCKHFYSIAHTFSIKNSFFSFLDHFSHTLEKFIFDLSFDGSFLMAETILFWSHIIEMMILRDLHVLWSPESKITFIAFGVSVYVIRNEFQQKLQTWYSTFVSYVNANAETFYEDRANSLYTETHKTVRMHYGQWTECLFGAF